VTTNICGFWRSKTRVRVFCDPGRLRRQCGEEPLVSDYYYACAARETAPAPVVFTLSVCGSMRTLEFLRWLGVDVPRWIENSLRHATDTLEASYRLALAAATDLIAYCRSLGVPFGINVESVSIRRVEIEMAVRLTEQLGAELRK
jgi:hypothetical protein